MNGEQAVASIVQAIDALEGLSAIVGRVDNLVVLNAAVSNQVEFLAKTLHRAYLRVEEANRRCEMSAFPSMLGAEDVIFLELCDGGLDDSPCAQRYQTVLDRISKIPRIEGEKRERLLNLHAEARRDVFEAMRGHEHELLEAIFGIRPPDEEVVERLH